MSFLESLQSALRPLSPSWGAVCGGASAPLRGSKGGLKETTRKVSWGPPGARGRGGRSALVSGPLEKSGEQARATAARRESRRSGVPAAPAWTAHVEESGWGHLEPVLCWQVSNNQLAEGDPWLVMPANFCGTNTPVTADHKLPT